MRYYPAAVALSLLAAVTASATFSAAPQPMDPRAAELVAQGRTEAAAGRLDAAIDAYEAALVLQPGNVSILISLGDVTRRQGMQGKAIHYYRKALEVEPRNLLAISGEGAALAEKGAIEKARRNLAQLRSLCGDNCEPTRLLSAAIAKGPAPKILTAEAVKPEPVVTEQ